MGAGLWAHVRHPESLSHLAKVPTVRIDQEVRGGAEVEKIEDGATGVIDDKDVQRYRALLHQRQGVEIVKEGLKRRIGRLHGVSQASEMRGM